MKILALAVLSLLACPAFAANINLKQVSCEDGFSFYIIATAQSHSVQVGNDLLPYVDDGNDAVKNYQNDAQQVSFLFSLLVPNGVENVRFRDGVNAKTVEHKRCSVVARSH